MEQFKLRMWNNASNSYLYDIDNVFECLKQQHKFDGTMPDRGFIAEWDHKSEGMKWEVYTGEKDIENTEIYQNDIMQHPKDGIFLVIWDKFWMGFAAKSPGSQAVDQLESKYLRECKKIGTLNEDLELFETQIL